MNNNRNFTIDGIPKIVPETTAAVCRSRLLKAINELLNETDLDNIKITVHNMPHTTAEVSDKGENDDELLVEKRAKQYQAQKPLFSFEQLIVSEDVQEELLCAIDLIRVESKVFEEWGLKKIEPFPRTALNFHGQPGTGKTLAAHAIAHSLQRPILVASYAQIESKFHGDGPKNVVAIFHAATEQQAVLFIDEADSLLSKRLTDVTQGSERAANSMCSQLLICLEKFRGVVIFATNLVENYDKAFETRVRHIHFPMPNEKARREIWLKHLPQQLPCSADVSVDELAKIEDICGREIKNAVIDASVRTARLGNQMIVLDDLVNAVNRIKTARISSNQNKNLTDQEQQKIRQQLQHSLSKQ